MNERIAKLANQCYYINTYTDLEMFNEEKFAELIVRECADAADMAYDARCAAPGDYVVEQMGFGLVEGVSAFRS